jgi:hypothetical protein
MRSLATTRLPGRAQRAEQKRVRVMKEEDLQKTTRLGTMLLLSVSCMAAFAGIAEFLAYLSGTSYCYIPQAVYGIFHETREVSELVARDRSGEYYEHETEFLFSDKAGRTGAMNFTFLWDVADGFDEDAVIFDNPNVTYEVGPAGTSSGKNAPEGNSAQGEGWRRLTIRCHNFDLSKPLTAIVRYPAGKIIVRDTAPGYYRWDLDLHTKEAIPELDKVMASFENPYACANWIRRNIVYKSLTREPQTAAETFRARQGDCDDRALLFCYMVKRLFPEKTPRVVEGWTVERGYHANVALRDGVAWLMLDPAAPSVRYGVFDLNPFVPAGRLSLPFRITDAKNNAVEKGVIGISFGDGTVREARDPRSA